MKFTVMRSIIISGTDCTKRDNRYTTKYYSLNPTMLIVAYYCLWNKGYGAFILQINTKILAVKLLLKSKIIFWAFLYFTLSGTFGYAYDMMFTNIQISYT